MYRSRLKRLLDLALSLAGFLLFFPIFLSLSLTLAVSNRGRVFFLQARPGKNGAIFRIVKFRTMNDKRDANGNLLPDSQRLTRIGSFVRKASLDEIPQLLNVISGDMSLVGPRPLLVEYLHLYNERQHRRHEVRPGITGWAQVNGRNELTWGKKFELDVWYVENLSFSLDLRILWLTIRKVVAKDGISSKTSLTMEKFTGNE